MDVDGCKKLLLMQKYNLLMDVNELTNYIVHVKTIVHEGERVSKPMTRLMDVNGCQWMLMDVDGFINQLQFMYIIHFPHSNETHPRNHGGCRVWNHIWLGPYNVVFMNGRLALAFF